MSGSGRDHSPNASMSAIAAATEARLRQAPKQPSAAQLAAEHERRQVFRRMIDPGIIRQTQKNKQGHLSKYLHPICEKVWFTDTVFSAPICQILHTIATNLLKEPENEKYKQFKTHNPIIKKNLIEAKGALEYAIELGFRPTVVKFEPMYVWDPKHAEELRVGAAILEEFTQLEKEKAEREERSKVDIKALNAARAQQVKLAYMDDRTNKKLLDERQKQLATTRALAAVQKKAQSPSDRTSTSPDPEDEPPRYTTLPMGPGRTLADTPPATSTPDDEEMS